MSQGARPELPSGLSVAASRMNVGGRTFRTSVTGERRGPLCGMGICFECRCDDEQDRHRRTCQMEEIHPSAFGLTGCPLPIARRKVESLVRSDVAVVGAGPAGIAAACVAAEAGRSVVLLDDNPGRGGQLWRGEEPAPKTALAREWFARLAASNVRTISGASVVGATPAGHLIAEIDGQSCQFEAPLLVLATGARELFLPFPGWTDPQVIGAGGIQALAKAGLDVRGQRILVAGSGPLLLAVAQNLRARGAQVPFIAEQADRAGILRFGLGLAAHPGKLLQALALQASLLGVRYRTRCWPTRVERSGAEICVTFREGEQTFTATADLLACGWGLVPGTELAELLGCVVERRVIRVDDFQETTRKGIYAVGETNGIAGVEAALISGEIAGWVVAGQPDRARALFGSRARARRFAAGLDRAFALRPELKTLPDDATIVCRCEDVTFGRLRQFGSWTEAKLQTRCGMGPCQGRVCGAAAEFLLGWEVQSQRPPSFPVSVSTLAAMAGEGPV
jgi:NADPH-dependent 2,4-dienoyl-CoA reductase/sulfur reductase-like enzyme